ncbi:MAG: hypothetical protein ACLUAR_17715 [Pilosibacter sp.]
MSSIWRNTVAQDDRSPPGYVGYEGGRIKLSEKVRRNPLYSVILLMRWRKPIRCVQYPSAGAG